MTGKSSRFVLFAREIVPTFGQVLLVSLGATVLIIAGRSQMVLRTLGVTPDGLEAAGESLRDQFQVVVNSPLVGNFVLMMFWASIGMSVYLVCWGVFAAWTEARNELVIRQSYTNRDGRGAHWHPMGIKVICAAFLAVVLAAFGPVLALAQLVAAPAFHTLSFGTASGLAASLIFLSGWLYLILLGVQLTFTPWYEDGVFTD